MNIYFSCSITGGRSDQAVYQTIVSHLLDLGHEVPTAILASPTVPSLESVVAPHKVYERDVNWVKNCDALVAEVSTPSHGVGYEIALALTLAKPVFCCHARNRRVSKMITGNSHPGIRVFAYSNEKELLTEVDRFLSEIQTDSSR